MLIPILFAARPRVCFAKTPLGTGLPKKIKNSLEASSTLGAAARIDVCVKFRSLGLFPEFY